MSAVDEPRRWLHAHALTILAVISVVLATMLILAYLQYVLLAIVLAYLLAPTQLRLEQHVSSMAAASILTVGTIFAVIIPIAYLLLVAIQQGLALLADIRAGGVTQQLVEDWLRTLGVVVEFDLILETYQEPLETGLERLASGAITVIGGIPSVVIGLTVTVFVLFALLRDGDKLLDWVRAILPVEDRVQHQLFEELDNLMWASVVGNVSVAAIQAMLLGIGMMLLGLSGVIFLTVVTFVFALLPVIGAFGVWLPVSVYLLALGRPVAAGLLVLYGSLVSASDMYLRPALISRSGTINVAIIVVGIFGGIVVFGAIGLFIGPVVLGGAKIILDLYAGERRQPSAT